MTWHHGHQSFAKLAEPDLTVLSGIKATVIMPSPSIPSGGEVWAELEIANVSETEIAFRTDDPLIATFVLPGTRSVVGAFGGAIAGVGLNVRLAPHATRLIPVIVGAWGHVSRERDPRTFQNVHDNLVPGSYGLFVCVPSHSQENGYQRQEIWSNEIPILVTPLGG